LAGIIGAGSITQAAHIAAFRSVPDVELVALCDINKERVQKVAQEHQIPHTYTDYRRMLRKQNLDLVAVCTPNALHSRMTIAALKAGANVLCEKPMALTYRDACAMIEASHKFERSLTVGFCLRHGPDAITAKQKVLSGALGQLYYCKASLLRRSGIPGYGSWFTNKDLAGGGAMMDIGCHITDLSLHLLGHPKPVTVSAMTYANFGPKAIGLGGWGVDHATPPARCDVDDLATAFVRFENGLAMTVEASWAGHGTDGMRIQLFGTEGGLELNPKLFGADKPLRWFTQRGAELIEETVELPPSQGSIYDLQAQAWVAAIRSGTPPAVLPEQAAMVAQIIEALYKSANSGKEVAIRA
jgi:predicted dehydrogenase